MSNFNSGYACGFNEGVKVGYKNATKDAEIVRLKACLACKDLQMSTQKQILEHKDTTKP